MEEFLKTVARHYLAKAAKQAAQTGEPATMPLSRYLFCFPNRRSGLFFARYLQDVHNGGPMPEDCTTRRPCCVPPMTTISELFGQFSQRHVLDRTALLFRLFTIYDRCSRRRERETFDQFVFWGDMLLSDFDDVDRYLVDADKLFANVRDLKEIDARFAGLTPEQIAVIRSFWKSYRPDVEYPEGDKREVFSQTWAILSQLYHEFRQSLSDNNEAYGGMLEREVVEEISRQDADQRFASFPYQKVVFVGLTAISEVDRRLMSMLRLNGMAEFCWDYADPRLQPKNSLATSAAYFSQSNLQDFGNELSPEELQVGLVAEKDRDVALYSVSSGVGQTRKAQEILLQWKAADGASFDPFRTAVVLPDEKLLLPMLYAVPSSFEHFNVTMGYNLKNTPIAAYVSQLADLQQSYNSEKQTFYFRQVLPLLSHAFTLSLAEKAARTLSQRINKENKNQVPVAEFANDKFLSRLFHPVSTAEETIEYLTDILQTLMTHTSDDVDYELLYHYHKTLSGLAKEVRSNAISFTTRTFFLLLEKLVAGVSVPFQGEPLKGLQIMGVLETRALDFDNVIILSMNEGVFPAKPSQNTFVPMSLRDAFGMPTQRHRDSVFAYHFYRLIGRAKRLAMIYDSRTEGMQTGEESRYVKQLRYLMGHPDLDAQTVVDEIGVVNETNIVVNKTPEVLELLCQCLGPQATRPISASVLKKYISCPLRFYLGFVRRLHEDDDVTEGIDSRLFGDILHDAVHNLYKGNEGQEIQASMLDKYIRNPEGKITQCVNQAFQKHCHVDTPTGYNQLIAGLIVDYIFEILRHDRKLCPFVYLAGEIRQTYLYDAGNGLQVSLMCVYDRLDMPLTGHGTLRVVDYKTGNSGKGSKLVFPDVDDLFRSEGRGSSEAFQVMMYSLMLGQLSAGQLAECHLTTVPEHVSPHLYYVRDFSSNPSVRTSLVAGTAKNGQEILDFAPYRQDFNQKLSALLTEIFNPDIPFAQCKEDSRECTYCPFATLCNRNK